MKDTNRESLSIYNLLPTALKANTLLPKGQRRIMALLAEFESGLTMTDIGNMLTQSKQALFRKVKGLLDEELIQRAKNVNGVYIYKSVFKVNEKILKLYLQREEKKRENEKQ